MFKIFGSRGKAGDCKVQRCIHLTIISWCLLYIPMRQWFTDDGDNHSDSDRKIVAHSLIR